MSMIDKTQIGMNINFMRIEDQRSWFHTTTKKQIIVRMKSQS